MIDYSQCFIAPLVSTKVLEPTDQKLSVCALSKIDYLQNKIKWQTFVKPSVQRRIFNEDFKNIALRMPRIFVDMNLLLKNENIHS